MNQLYQLFDAQLYDKCDANLNQYLEKFPSNLQLLTLKCLTLMQKHCPSWKSKDSALLPNEIPVIVWSFVLPVVDKLITATYSPKESPSADDLYWIRYVCTLMKALALYEECFKFLSLQIERYKSCNEEIWRFALYSVSRLSSSFDIQAAWAMKMFQLLKQTHYMRWSYLSSWMHDDPKRRALALTLAHKTLLAEKQPFVDEWFRFILIMLRREHRWKDVVTLLLDERATSIDKLPIDRKTFLAEALKENHQIVEANALYSYLLDINREEWTWWTGFLETFEMIRAQKLELPTQDTISLEYNCGGPSKTTLQLPNAARNPLKFIKGLQEIELQNYQGEKVRRGPFLAELEYLYRIGDTKSLENACVSYFIRFCTKPLCFSDLRKFLTPSIYQKVNEYIKSYPGKDVDKVKAMITLRRIEYYLRIISESIEEHVKTLISEYHSALQFGVGVETTENQHGDELLLLAAFHLIDGIDFKKSNFSSEESTRMIRAIYILEYGLQKSTFNYQFKILLIRLYAKLKVFRRALSLFDSLDIKNILWESISYILLYDLYDSGSLSMYPKLLKRMLKYRYQHERGTPDLLLLAYRNETYSKVVEFIEFQKRLDTSITTNLFASYALLNGINPRSSPQSIYEKLHLSVKPLESISTLFTNPTRNDDDSVLVDLRSSDPNVGHPILCNQFESTKLPIHSAAYYHSIQIIESLAHILVDMENGAQRAKVEKQISKKSEKVAKKLMASLSHIPSNEAIAASIMDSKSKLDKAAENYWQLLDGSEQSKMEPLWHVYAYLFKFSSLIAQDKKDEIEKMHDEFCKKMKEFQVCSCKHGVMLQICHISSILFTLWSQLGYKITQIPNIVPIFQELMWREYEYVERDVSVTGVDLIFDESLLSFVKSNLQMEKELDTIKEAQANLRREFTTM